MGEIIDLLKSTRIQRVSTILTAILVPSAIYNKINLNILFFGLIYIFIYSAVGIHNAKKDEDYLLPKRVNLITWILFAISLIISFQNKLLFITAISIITLGIIYNTLARKVLFGDTIILSITHNTLPVFISSLLIGQSILNAFKLSFFFFIVLWPLINIKNLKDYKQDIKRKYKTIGTEFENRKQISKILIIATCFLSSFAPIIFKMNSIFYLLFFSYLTINLIIYNLISKEKYLPALNLMRLSIIIFFTSFILDKTEDIYIIFINSIILIAYVFFMVKTNNETL